MKKKTNSNGVREILYYNDTVDMIYEACTACYNNTKDISYQEKKEYIAKRVNAGHDSVLEHGYVSFLIHDITSEDYTRCLSEIIGYSHYLYIYASELEDGSHSLLIGGSVRAYKYLLSEYSFEYGLHNLNNFIINHIINILSETTVKEFYPELDEEITNTFVDIVSDPFDYTKDICDNWNSDNRIEKDLYTIYNLPSIEKIEELKDKVFKYGFIYSTELLSILPISICFKNMSRTATHQLVRHRNAITQESQRYVDYSKAGFTIPDMSEYMSDYKDKKFDININGNTMNITLQELATALLGIYPQLLKYGIKKEDARAFLPSNVQCGRLYMTFTIFTFNKFINLRTDPHAQSEIRKYAVELTDDLYDYLYVMID